MADTLPHVFDVEQPERFGPRPPDEAAERRRRWQNHVLWSVFVAAALVVYERTQNAALGSIIACLKFTWDDLMAGLWLVRRDPDRRRGQACLRFYLAAGLWRTSMMAGLITFVCYLFGAAAWGNIAAHFALALGCMLLSAVVTLSAVVCCIRCRRRVWVDSAVRRSRIEDVWPPAHTRRNVALAVAKTAAATLGLLLVVLMGAVLAGGGGAVVVRWFPAAANLIFACGILLMPIVLAVSYVASERFLARHVVARTPDECWPR